MVRSFDPKPLEPSAVTQLLDRARRAPSAGNTQATSFLSLQGPEATAAYWDTTLPEPKRATFRWQGLLDAPVLIVVTVDAQAYVERYAESDKAHPRLGDGLDEWTVPFWWVDAGAVIQNILLLAVNDGLGACLFGLFDHEAAVAQRFDVPASERLVATIALGHPLPDQPSRSAGRRRPSIAEVHHINRWS